MTALFKYYKVTLFIMALALAGFVGDGNSSPSSPAEPSLFFFKQKTAYEFLRSDWSSDVCSSDLSPFTSPTPATEVPLSSSSEAPVIAKPSVPSSAARSSAPGSRVLAPNTTKLRPEREPSAAERRAPTIMSSRPSPFTSPAPETDQPVRSLDPIPSMANPSASSRLDSAMLAAPRVADPKIT